MTRAVQAEAASLDAGTLDALSQDTLLPDALYPDAPALDAPSMDAPALDAPIADADAGGPCDYSLTIEMSDTPGAGDTYAGSCPLPPPTIEMDDGSDPPEPPGIDPTYAARPEIALLAPDPQYDPTTYQPGSYAQGNYSVSQWVLGADNCADYYDDQGARLFRNHFLHVGLGVFFLGYSFAEAQAHGKVDCSNDGKGNCVVSTCGGTTRATGGGYTGVGPNEYWGGDMADRSGKLNNTTCDLNVGAYSAVSINRQFKAEVTAKIPVNAQGIPIQADANVLYADNGGVIFGHKLKSDTVVTCKAPGVK